MNAVEHKEIQEVNLKVDSLVKSFTDQRAEIKEIRDALLGNDFSEKQGLVKKVSALEERVESLEKWFDRVKWFLIGLAFVGGAGFAKLVGIISNVMK
jgi:hypothetical protein